MPAPSTTAGQTPAGSAPVPSPALGSPRGRRRAPVAPVAPAGPSAGPDREWGTGAGAGTADPAGDVVRWAVFCCVLVPVVLVVYGTSLGGAAGTALGLVTVTAACRVLLRRSERGLRAETVRTRRRN
ncbi:hypothetical protein ACFU5Y_35010 [Streptomyces gardneri]|uniref:hypothetical protein n=1 Tax=Streptomyces gardneri TaxID=66892 RepID=UPI0036B7620C